MNPFKETYKSIEKTYKNWKSINVKPYDKNEVDPYTRVRIILMNGMRFPIRQRNRLEMVNRFSEYQIRRMKRG